MDLMGFCRVFATSNFMQLMAVLSYKSQLSEIMVRESTPEDDSANEDRGSLLREPSHSPGHLN